MNSRTVIAVKRVCDYYHIDLEIVRGFSEFGLCPTVIFNGELGIEAEHLDRLEEIITLHQALGINKEGIDVILELRDKVSSLQDEVEALQSEVDTLKRQLWNMGPEALESHGLLIDIYE